MKKLTSAYSIKAITAWLWRSSSDNRLQAWLNTLIGLAEVAVSLVSVWAVKRAIDIASGSIIGTAHGAQPIDVITAVCLMGALLICSFALNVAEVWVRNILGIRAQNRMQERMLARILHQQWQGRDAMHSGDVLNRLEQDVQTVVNFVAETLPTAVSTLALFIGAFCYLFSLDHVLAVIIVVVFPIFLIASKVYIKKMRRLSRVVRECDSNVQSLLQDTVQNRILVKTLEGENFLVERLADRHATLRRKVVERTRFSVFSNILVNIGFASGYLIAFGWSALRLADGTLTYGGMTAFLQLVNKIQNPARNLTRLVPKFIDVITAAERLMALEDVPAEHYGEIRKIAGPCGVKLDNVGYAYADTPEKTIINGLSFDFRPGSCTAILGETGAGKTTLLRMILALIQPTSGRLYIYNKVGDEAEVTQATRCNFTYVPQGNTLMSGTIRSNLLMANPNATDSEMIVALRTACADFVLELFEGLDTVITENGKGLSEGQAQRIAIARALLRKAPILILDEATSALDTDTERELLHNILSTNNQTILFITHRKAVLQYCDASLEITRNRDFF